MTTKRMKCFTQEASGSCKKGVLEWSLLLLQVTWWKHLKLSIQRTVVARPGNERERWNI